MSLAVLSLPLAAFAQGGLYGGGALWLPSIPLSPAAVANGAQVTYSDGMEFITVSNHGNGPNPAFPGVNPPGIDDDSRGRGSVSEDFRIGRFEVPTAMWAEFYNAAFNRPQVAGQSIPFVQLPSRWGAVNDSNYSGPGRGWTVPAGNEMRAVGGIDWRTAAIFCNWLCNGRGTDRNDFLTGAYDVSTFGYSGPFNNIFTDQATHTPGAQYWIPNLDQWIMASHYDHNRFGPGQGGYWEYDITQDTAPVLGMPVALGGSPLAQANTAFQFGGLEYTVLLGSYPNVQSPWGLLDSAGMTSEWTESVITDNIGRRFRYFDGSAWTGHPAADWIGGVGAQFPSIPLLEYGLRIATVVPAPGATGFCVTSLALLARRRGR